MKHFVVVYDRHAGLLLRADPFDSHGAAFVRLTAMERKYRGDANVEIVLLNADSDDALLKTHGRYFISPIELLQRAS
jgi:hypothetical protein